MPQVLVEPITGGWVAFSPKSGKTSVLNDESASILEVLRSGPTSADATAAQLGIETGLDSDHLLPLLQPHWQQLIDAGLIEPEVCSDAGPL